MRRNGHCASEALLTSANTCESQRDADFAQFEPFTSERLLRPQVFESVGVLESMASEIPLLTELSLITPNTMGLAELTAQAVPAIIHNRHPLCSHCRCADNVVEEKAVNIFFDADASLHDVR